MSEKPSIQSQQKYLEFWVGGMNSLLFPTNVQDTQYHWGENIICRGGIPQTRPGLDLRLSVPGTNLQGFTMFTPRKGIPHMVIAVDGKVYVSRQPFLEYTQLPNISFLPDAEIVTFADCVKSVNNEDDGRITLITPKKVLVMQDGVSRAAYWDGVNDAHINPQPPTQGTPTGLWMAWASSRLWIIRGSQVVVSDYADPLSFKETTYLAERSNFELPDTGTGLIEASDRSGLLAFTRKTTTLFKSSIRQRTLWPSTTDFQEVIIPEVGCVAGRSPINHFGVTWWMSEAGLVNVDNALFTQRTSQLRVADGEMMRSKRNMSPLDYRACTGRFDNVLLVSVPSGSNFCGHTWVLDQAVADQFNSDSPPAWAGVWTGFRPVQWARLNQFGQERLFCAAFDATKYEDTNIHIWEAMKDDRLDRGNRISCQFETKEILPTSRLITFRYAELDLIEIIGHVRLKVYYAGIKGGYEEILDTVLTAEEGSIGQGEQAILSLGSVLQGYKPQSRIVKTSEVTKKPPEKCGPESERPPATDKAFSLLVEWQGRLAIRGIRLVYDPEPENEQGECAKSEVDKVNILTDQGTTP